MFVQTNCTVTHLFRSKRNSIGYGSMALLSSPASFPTFHRRGGTIKEEVVAGRHLVSVGLSVGSASPCIESKIKSSWVLFSPAALCLPCNSWINSAASRREATTPSLVRLNKTWLLEMRARMSLHLCYLKSDGSDDTVYCRWNWVGNGLIIRKPEDRYLRRIPL